MDTVYFDTFVYNKLIDDEKLRKQILSLKKNNRIEIIFSDYLFNELVSTWSQDNKHLQERCRLLFNCVLELISDKILKQRETINREEIEAFLYNKEKGNVFFDSKEINSRIEAMKRLAEGDPITNIDCLDSINKSKQEIHAKIKYTVSKHNPKNNKIMGEATFEEYYSQPKNKEEEEQFIKDLLKDKILDNPNEEQINNVIKNIDNLPCFKSFLRMCAVYNYLLCKNKEVLRGDDYDQRHFTCASSIDILVSDGDFINILLLVYPEKKCFTLEEFIEKYIEKSGTN